MTRLSKLMAQASNVQCTYCTMVNGSSIIQERVEIAEERGIRRGIREKGEIDRALMTQLSTLMAQAQGGNRLSASAGESTIKKSISHKQ